MTLREKYGNVKPDQLADIAALFDETDKLESDLANANSLIGEKDKKIGELQEQANRLYARVILSETGESHEEEEHEETLEEFNDKIRKQIVGE